MSDITKEDLLPKIPTLKVDGSNWLTFKNHVEWATEAKGLVEYLEVTKTKPANPSEGKDASWKPTTESKRKWLSLSSQQSMLNGDRRMAMSNSFFSF